MNPIVSIILPNRNYEDFVKDAIESIKAQSIKEWECIIIDDASTDNSVEVIRTNIENDPRFKLITNSKSIGISACRNIGLDLATGEYVAFLDSDDCYTEYALEMLLEVAKKANVDIAGAKCKFVDGYFNFKVSNTKWNTDNITIYTTPLELLLEKQESKWVWIWRRIYKRSLLKNIRFPEDMKINGDDITFMLDLTYRVSKIAEVSFESVYHRIHPLSITSDAQNFNKERVSVFPKLFKHIKEDLIDKYDKKFLSNLYKQLFSYMLSECFVKHSIQLTKEDIVFLRKLLAEACRLIPKKYLPIKERILCRYLSWQK